MVIKLPWCFALVPVANVVYIWNFLVHLFGIPYKTSDFHIDSAGSVSRLLIDISLKSFGGFFVRKAEGNSQNCQCIVLVVSFLSFIFLYCLNICSLTLYFVQNNFKNILSLVLFD